MSTPSITLDAEGNLHLGPRIIPIPKHISPEAQQWLAMPRKARRSAGNCDASRTSTWVRGKSPLTAPLDAFKLDASSVRDILINPGDLAMAMTVIALGHNFKRVTQGAKAAENYYVTQGTETLAVAMPKPPAPRYENSPVGR